MQGDNKESSIGAVKMDNGTTQRKKISGVNENHNKRKLHFEGENEKIEQEATTGHDAAGGSGGSGAKPYRHSISYINNPPKLESRRSSFASPSSSFARRRSFLSPSMISNEKHTVYDLHHGGAMSGFNNTPSFSISLKESQGFSWNQDLFASQYQQQSSAIYDDDDDDDYDEECEDGETDADDDHGYSNHYGSHYSRSLSMSNESGYKVRVIDIKVDEDENIFQVEA